MTKYEELNKRIDELEKRVEELEKRPYYIYFQYPSTTPIAPLNPQPYWDSITKTDSESESVN